MPAKRLNPNRAKTHFNYDAGELARLFEVHKNTVRNWRREGLADIGGRPALFTGKAVRAFLAARNAARKRSCPPGHLFCFRCRDRRRPALGLVDFDERERGAGDLTALCEHCETVMHRRARREALGVVMPGLAVTIRQAEPRLRDQTDPSLNCGLTRRGKGR